MNHHRNSELPVAEKANRILTGLMVILFLISAKIWHLAVVQHEQKIEESVKPQRRSVIESAARAPIYDRFGEVLAKNKIQYNVSIAYGGILEVPRTRWVKEGKKRWREFVRKNYITRFSQMLAHHLHIDSQRIEDLIHSKAAVLGNIPCLLKEDISEELFYRLKMLEKDWPGLVVEMQAKREYPYGAMAGEIIGYLGPISAQQYKNATQEMRELREVLKNAEDGGDSILPPGFQSLDEVKEELEKRERRAYSIVDAVGKSGVEASFDQRLRGEKGKRLFLADRKGNFLRELPGSQRAKEGRPLHLTISAELQAYAERLLVEYENEPYTRSHKRQVMIPENQPWIKGGGIVVMNPNSGEVYAMAGSPRFDPRSFSRTGDEEEKKRKNYQIHRCLEDEAYVHAVWDFQIPVSRERFDPLSGEYFFDSKFLSWNEYLKFILPPISPVRDKLSQYPTLESHLILQSLFKDLCSLFQTYEYSLEPNVLIDLVYIGEEEVPLHSLISIPDRDFFNSRMQEVSQIVNTIKLRLEPFFESLIYNREKLLLVDLSRLIVAPGKFSPRLVEELKALQVNDLREDMARAVPLFDQVKNICSGIFHEEDFARWREENQIAYLEEKRREEQKEKRKYSKPYLDYLDQKERELFDAFWDERKWELVASFISGDAYGSEDEYQEVLHLWGMELSAGAYPAWEWTQHFLSLQASLKKIPNSLLLDYLKSFLSYEELNEELYGRYPGLRLAGEKRELKDLAAAFHPKYGYGFARSNAFRQATVIGSIFKLIPAYEMMRQNYMKALERGEKLTDLNPLVIRDDKHKKGNAWNVGYWDGGGSIPIYYKGGRLPRTEHAGVGRVDLPKALAVSSNPYFALLAGDLMEDPEDLVRAANLFGYGEKTGISLPGEYAGELPSDVAYNRSGLYALAIGQHSLVGTPLQTAVMLSTLANGGDVLRPLISTDEEKDVRWRLFLPSPIRHLLMEGMHQVIFGEKGTARGLKREFNIDYLKRVVGKTSTSEVMERFSLDSSCGVLKDKVIWFGAILFSEEGAATYSDAELVVVVYLKNGMYGRLAAPYALKLMQKWEQIKKKKKIGTDLAN
jgi:cell division protein FtsI/penicillin-binding protein 2